MARLLWCMPAAGMFAASLKAQSPNARDLPDTLRETHHFESESLHNWQELDAESLVQRGHPFRWSPGKRVALADTDVSVKLPISVAIHSICDGAAFHQGEYIYEGRTSSGAPFYKSTQAGQPFYDAMYLYYDPACKSATDDSAKWVFDNDAPSLTRESDLDGDGRCAFWGRQANVSSERPPMGTTTWNLFCKDAWKNVSVTLNAGVQPVNNSLGSEPVAQQEGRLPSINALSDAWPPPSLALKVVSQSGNCSGGYWQQGTYHLQGKTQGGSPVYKSVDAGKPYFKSLTMYYDPDCNGQGARPRWVIDNDEPNLFRPSDLDNDGQCAFWGRFNSADSTAPPIGDQTWRMVCDGNSWLDVGVTLEPMAPPTSTSTTITTTTLSTTLMTSPSSTPPPLDVPPLQTIRLSFESYCSELDWQAGVYHFVGRTSGGSPIYRSTDAGKPYYQAVYLYHDPSCNGKHAVPRWVVDNGAPNTTAVEDLDGDGQCAFWGRFNTDHSGAPPMGSNVWKMYCNDAWTEVQVKLEPVLPSTTTTTTTTTTMTITTFPPPLPMVSVSMSGFCAMSTFQGDYYYRGRTADGSPYYRSTGAGKLKASKAYIYHDVSCDGKEAAPRWVIDSDEPNTTAASDLDHDSACSFLGSIRGDDKFSLPMGANIWTVQCGNATENVTLALATMHYVPQTTMTYTTSTETTTTESTTTLTTVTIPLTSVEVTTTPTTPVVPPSTTLLAKAEEAATTSKTPYKRAKLAAAREARRTHAASHGEPYKDPVRQAERLALKRAASRRAAARRSGPRGQRRQEEQEEQEKQMEEFGAAETEKKPSAADTQALDIVQQMAVPRG